MFKAYPEEITFRCQILVPVLLYSKQVDRVPACLSGRNGILERVGGNISKTHCEWWISQESQIYKQIENMFIDKL